MKITTNATAAPALTYYCGRCGRLPKNQTRQETDDGTVINCCLECGDEVAGPFDPGQYTPGPWEVNKDGATVFCCVHVIDTVVCNTIGRPIDAAFFGQTVEEQEANVRLIAAAPEMYEALKAMQKALNESPFDTMGMLLAHRAIDRAVLKAEGREPESTPETQREAFNECPF